MIARDVMLNPDETLSADVHAHMYHEEAGEYFPDEDHGWRAEFTPGQIRPKCVFGWRRVKAAIRR